MEDYSLSQNIKSDFYKYTAQTIKSNLEKIVQKFCLISYQKEKTENINFGKTGLIITD